MFSALTGMASMFGFKRQEETQTEVLKDIYGDLQKIKKSFEITIVPASEEREKEFDKEKRHQELLAAFRRAGLGMSGTTSGSDGDKDDDKDKKGNWLTRLAMNYFSYRVLKGFIRRFFKVMRLGRLWTLLRGMGFLLTRLFWPLAVAGALIWAIPKIIDNWPEIVETAKNTVIEGGGVYIIGTERHEARRIDNQLRGRSGRQGDPGHSKFFLSLDDDLMRIFVELLRVFLMIFAHFS